MNTVPKDEQYLCDAMEDPAKMIATMPKLLEPEDVKLLEQIDACACAVPANVGNCESCKKSCAACREKALYVASRIPARVRFASHAAWKQQNPGAWEKYMAEQIAPRAAAKA